MNEELGVLIGDDKTSYFFKMNVDGKPLYCKSFFNAYHCTRKEAEQFPQFKWVALSDL
ncbi:hypothetical protein [Streptococcus iniae]|uniref:hypothetical protein n=1 Tax=Streptococcus iniae TaxID=1346 RepID=UPI001605141F|nr:hypothetical protein [Streptococcus iniae]WLR88572.1 hypothetical protein Q9317_04525 [Streptococcus iniae]